MSKKRLVTKTTTKQSPRQNVYQLEQALVANGRAWAEGPKKRTWSKHDLKHIKPMTATQQEFIRSFLDGKNIMASGSAGSGKSFVGLYLALNEILTVGSEVHKIILIRSAVATRDQGFLPGTLEEKLEVFEAPYHSIFQDLLGRSSSYQDMKDAGLVEFNTTSYIRGLTWDNAVVVVDESQNMSFHEIHSVMTRLGKHSRIILLGDLIQTDLRKNKGDVCGLDKALRITNNMTEFTNIYFTRDDIVRSGFVKSWITSVEDDEQTN